MVCALTSDQRNKMDAASGSVAARRAVCSCIESSPSQPFPVWHKALGLRA